MFTKKFSLETAYAAGARIVLNYFMFFVLAIFVGMLASAAALIFLGIIDFYALRYHMAPLIKLFHHISNSATGALHYTGLTVQESVKPYLSSEVAQQSLGRDIISIDISSYDVEYLAKVLVPTMLALKFFIDMITVGWTKIALELSVNQPVKVAYLFNYYYLVPRVFVANLIVGIATIVGTMFFIIPGIFVYQRLRFAKYFIIDKNLSIVKALQSSWALTEQATLQLFGFTIISVLLEAIGTILTITYLFLIPLQNQAEANVYRQLIDNK